MSEAAPLPNPDPRYVYRDIRPPAIPQEVLDGIAANVFNPQAAKDMGWFALLKSGIYLTVAVIYLIARARLIKAQLEYTKQRYELDQARQNQTDLDHDDLSGERRPG